MPQGFPVNLYASRRLLEKLEDIPIRKPKILRLAAWAALEEIQSIQLSPALEEASIWCYLATRDHLDIDALEKLHQYTDTLLELSKAPLAKRARIYAALLAASPLVRLAVLIHGAQRLAEAEEQKGEEDTHEGHSDYHGKAASPGC